MTESQDRAPVRRVAASSSPSPVVTQAQETPEEKLFKFVDEQIGMMSKYSDLGGTNDAPGFYELNEALL